MDLLKQRLTFASFWEFEEFGVRELEEELHQAIPHAECHCEYSSAEKALITKGKLSGHTAQICAMISTFIEKQKNKDLLDTPRLRLMNLAAAVRDTSSAVESPAVVEEGGLLALDDGSEEIVPHPLKQVVKFWLSSEGGVGRFAARNYQEFLDEIAKGTGTEVTIFDDLKGLQVAGRTESDVNDALAKLSRIEKPLSHLHCPPTHNLVLTTEGLVTCYRIQPYASVNPVALSRILVDPSSSLNAGLGQMFVTVSYAFDEDLQQYMPPKCFSEPPQCANLNGHSRIWNDFTFTEVGKGDEFQALESTMESSQSVSPLVPVVVKSHPFLSAQKAEQVEEWVVDRSNMDATETAQPPGPEGKKSASPAVKKATGIKVRRPVQSTRVDKASATTSEPPVLAGNSDDNQSKPRKHWTMNYEPVLPSTSATQTPCAVVGNATRSYRHSSNQPTPSISPKVERPQSQNTSANALSAEKQDLARQLIALGSQMESEKRTHIECTLAKKSAQIEESAALTLELEDTPLLLINFELNKYGANKTTAQANKTGNGSPKTEIASRNTSLTKTKSSHKPIDKSPVKHFNNSGNKPSNMSPRKPLTKHNELIDISSPAETTKVKPLSCSFDAPPLVPERPKRRGEAPTHFDSFEESSAVPVDAQFPDLAGLSFGSTADNDRSSTSGSLQDVSSCKPYFLNQARRLQSLNYEYRSQVKSMAVTLQNPCSRPGDFNRVLERRAIENYERARRSEAEQPVNEMESRKYHRTMNQRTANPSQKSKGKAASVTKKQATLEDAWGEVPKRNKAKTTSETSPGQVPTKKGEKGVRVNENLRRFFTSLKPTLAAAESFPGALSLEIQFGLILIPIMPKTCSDKLMSLSEWSKIFQPQSGIKAPSTKFVNRMSVCGAETDHIVDLKTSKAEGKSRMFAEAYDEYNISYEFHCRAKGGELLIIAMDEQGRHTIKKPSSVLGAVNLHCPKQIWDARAVISSAAEYRPGTDSELEEAAQHLADCVWIPAGKNLRILTSLPKGSKLEIHKVFMKRWTRHRYLRPAGALGRDSQLSKAHGSDAQDIFLQVKEVQESIIGIGQTNELSDKQHVRARYDTPAEMIQRGKLWYELSLVSPAIETILKANKSLEVGERVQDWHSTDLFGYDAALLTEQPSTSPLSPVAANVGAAGIADMLRLAKSMIEKMDGVGACNRGPMATDTVRASANSSQVNKGLDFDDLESVREVESVTARVNQDPLTAAASKQQQFEKDFW
ncbi:hypothetical protein BDV12DRAFT_153272 [Aspergillus spectabilis]